MQGALLEAPQGMETCDLCRPCVSDIFLLCDTPPKRVVMVL